MYIGTTKQVLPDDDGIISKYSQIHNGLASSLSKQL